MGRILVTALFLVSGIVLADGSCTCGLNFWAGQSREAIDKILPGSEIYMVEGKLRLEGKCKDDAEWVYHYVSLEDKKSGWVRYALNKECQMDETSGIDDVTGGMGYYLLRNFRQVKIGGSDAARVVQEADKDFVWSGDFSIFQRLHPQVKEPNYLIYGTKSGQKTDYLVNAWTSQIIQ